MRNKKFGGFRLFAGVECDILRDGSFDFEDEILAELDFAVLNSFRLQSLRSRDDQANHSARWKIRRSPFSASDRALVLKRDPYLRRSSGRARGRGCDWDLDRTQRCGEATRSGLAMVALAKRKASNV